jgi:signal transduction histidine kinase
VNRPGSPRRTAFQTWTLRRLTGTAFISLAVILTLLVVAVVFTGVRFARTGNDVIYRWDRSGAYGRRLDLDVVNQETGIRGYALARKPVFLQPFRQYRAQQRGDTAALHGLLDSDPQLHNLLEGLLSRIDEWQRMVVVPLIAQVHAGRSPTPASLVAGKASFDRIRARSTALQNGLRDKTMLSRRARTGDAELLVALVSVGLLLIFASGGVLWIGLNRWVLGPVYRLGDQTREVASGETYKHIVPGGPVELTNLGEDVEAMRREIAAQLELAERTQSDLARSNQDLQRFAYVASHDLSEPLRKVANFCQLLERQYGDQLDDRARQYIDFAVDGAKRMQVLITDLLALSRVGRTTERFERINLDLKLDQALATLGERIADAGATVERLTPLPTVDGDRALLISLWQNLIGNAVKYRREDVAPVIRISAERDENAHMWTITISDNGIGIDPQYAERIFAVFQRLHLRDQYGGTGIGLALCRRIVEFHGGEIWLADVGSGQIGSTFRFTIPESGRRAEPRD